MGCVPWQELHLCTEGPEHADAKRSLHMAFWMSSMAAAVSLSGFTISALQTAGIRLVSTVEQQAGGLPQALGLHGDSQSRHLLDNQDFVSFLTGMVR